MEAHLAGGVVADEAHGVELLIGRSGSDEHMLAGEGARHGGLAVAVRGFFLYSRPGVSCFGLKILVERGDDVLRFLHASLSLQSGSEEARARFDDMVAIAAQCLKIALRGGMTVHVQVHGGSNEDRRFHGEVGGDEHVVGDGVGHFAETACRAGCDEHGVGPQSEIHVGVPRAVALCEEITDDGLMGQCAEGDRSDELLARGRDDDLHLSPALDESADDQT